ncbi:cytochrome c1 [Ferrimonas marina]|uniref:Ubiquinol-cytochrome c reductase cytochrome c1 subunit n=1 Tax=Ferrimonas marina TaxID=299255 RepID=A0A1M5Y2D6_9GAMM|nr:cytochrome c1 [Ferrimonas marina]SHI06260.1 ubiquinol-cytochrome c reductase cytochrome c1 subunit [Ferrimonas marina]
MKKIFVTLLACLPALTFAAGGHNPHVVKADIDLHDQASLQRGATAFIENCLGCHSTQYQRYERVANDVGFSIDEINELIYTDAKVGDLMFSAMPQEQAAKWFGAAPPDLTMVARVRGSDWVYSYLTTFYQDQSRPFGVNNLVFPSVGMPHVLERLQGVPVLQEDGSIVASGGSLSAEEYDQFALDLTNFLTYSAEPIRLERERLGKWVLGFLAIFFVLAYLLKREYWRDVH